MEAAGCSAVVSFAEESSRKRNLLELTEALLNSYTIAPRNSIAEIAPLQKSENRSKVEKAGQPASTLTSERTHHLSNQSR